MRHPSPDRRAAQFMFASPRRAKHVRTSSCANALARISYTRGLASFFIVAAPAQQGDSTGVVNRQAGLTLPARITLPHLSVSSAISFPKAADVPPSVVAPRSARRAFSLGSARPALITLLSLLTISLGVFFGAQTPFHPLASYPGTNSP